MPALAASPDQETTARAYAQPTLRERLRDATTEAHAALDARLQALDLTTLAGYRRFLAANAAALLPLERALEAAGVRTLVPDWDARARSRAIFVDLDLLGIDPKPVAINAALNRARMFGVLYVLEGSRLGAKFLARQVMRSSDPLVRAATAYLTHGEGERFWPSFLALLEREDAAPAEAAEMTAGAQWAFARFADAAACA